MILKNRRRGPARTTTVGSRGGGDDTRERDRGIATRRTTLDASMDSFSCLTVRGTRDSARPWERCGERRREEARGREWASARGAKKIDRTTTRARNVASRRGRRRDRARVRARTRRSPMPRTIARETRARAAESRGRLLAPRRERRAIARESTHRAAVRAARGRGLARGEAALSSELGRAAVVTSVHGARVKERASGRVDVRGDASARV